MKAGRPKSSSSKIARRTARSDDLATADLQQRKPAARTRTTRSLLTVLLGDPRLDADDREAISDAHSSGLTVQDLSALTVYELRLAQILHAEGELASKDLIVALNKAATHVAAAAQLGASDQSTGADITVTFLAVGGSSGRPEAAQLRPPDPVVGDTIDAE